MDFFLFPNYSETEEPFEGKFERRFPWVANCLRLKNPDSINRLSKEKGVKKIAIDFMTYIMLHHKIEDLRSVILPILDLKSFRCSSFTGIINIVCPPNSNYRRCLLLISSLF